MKDLFNEFVHFSDIFLQEIISNILEFVPAGISLRQILHFGQLIRSGKFHQFDYDDAYLNMVHYGDVTPPEFDLNRVSVNISIYLSKDDTTTTMGNVIELRDRLPCVKQTYTISEFSHSDFIYNEKAAELVYKKVISNMIEADIGQYE